jgi:hypothetical protein
MFVQDNTGKFPIELSSPSATIYRLIEEITRPGEKVEPFSRKVGTRKENGSRNPPVSSVHKKTSITTRHTCLCRIVIEAISPMALCELHRRIGSFIV